MRPDAIFLIKAKQDYSTSPLKQPRQRVPPGSRCRHREACCIQVSPRLNHRSQAQEYRNSYPPVQSCEGTIESSPGPENIET